jgi:hypothetical protein
MGSGATVCSGLGRRGSKIEARLRRRRRRASGTVGVVGLPSFTQPYSTAWSWQSGQTSTKSEPFGAKRIARSPRSRERSQIAHVRVAVELVMRCTRPTIAPVEPVPLLLQS